MQKAIQSGCINPDSAIGIYAGDAQSYQVFSRIFEPIIFDYHGVSKDTRHLSDFNVIDLPEIDPDGRHIKSTRIRVARNIKGFDFSCHISLPHRRKLEQKIVTVFNHLKGNLKGEYVSFESKNLKKIDRLEKENLWFKKGDRFQDAAGINSDFPKCRGVFYSIDKKFIVWVNEEDHLRIISIEKTSNVSAVFNRLCQAIQSLNTHLDFPRHSRFGYLTSCPTNIGTSMRASVHIQLKKLDTRKKYLDLLAKKYQLQIRGTSGEKTQVRDAVFDISNRQRFGVSETHIIKNLHKGLAEIIATEKNL